MSASEPQKGRHWLSLENVPMTKPDPKMGVSQKFWSFPISNTMSRLDAYIPVIRGGDCPMVLTHSVLSDGPQWTTTPTVKLYTASFSLLHITQHVCVHPCTRSRKQQLEGLQLTCGCGGTPRFCLLGHPVEVRTYFLLSVLCPMLHQNPQSRL